MVRLPEEFTDKEEYVQSIFSKIAHRYDLLNTALSFNRDKHWRQAAVSRCGLSPGGKGLDVGCGTGKLSIEMARAMDGRGEVVGLDFTEKMLEIAGENAKRSRYHEMIHFVQGNAMELPFADQSFDCAIIGFALRNVSDIRQTIREMARVVRNGGKVVSLELSKPSAPVFKQTYYFYFNHLVPLLGRMGVGQDGPYSYLPNSLKDFPHQSEIKKMFEQEGLVEVSCQELTGGVVSIHSGVVIHGGL